MLKHMVFAVIGDGYLYGAAPDAPGCGKATGSYWQGLRLEGESFALYFAAVPEALARACEAQGTSEQEFADGYEAWHAVLAHAPHPFMLDSWSPGA
jgi:hypothetical protein